MPELPDVEVFKREVADQTIHEMIKSITVKRSKVVKGTTSLTTLKGHRIMSTKRIGKNLFIEFDGKDHLRLHFGMTGFLVYEKDEGLSTKNTCVTFHFNSGKRLDFVDPRMFGAVEIIPDVEEYLKSIQLGPDVETLSEKEFISILKTRHGQLKPALMDQNLMSGLGNVYTDEVLFQAKIHPEKEITGLTNIELKRIYKKMDLVLKEAIKDHADRLKMPGSFLINHRSPGEKCPRCRTGTIEMKQTGGRSTYFCSQCQK